MPEYGSRSAPCLLRVVSSQGRPPCLAVAQDVSPRGGVLLASAAQDEGRPLLQEPDCPGPRAGLLFRVNACEGLAGGGYLLTGLFVPPLTDEEVRWLAGAEPLPPSPPPANLETPP